MKTRRSFRPALQPLEERVVLSFSFSRMMHSVFPFIKDTTKADPAAAHVAAARSAAVHPVASHVARAVPTENAAPAVAGRAHPHAHAHAHPQGLHARVFHARAR